ncbi:PEP-utilizing enzyme [Antrihabitans spumae]|uniref:PEP-utilizing enzyme n=1 Tax=Antrihabitans spumae TaxID=3373370 RepID=A0ABW7JZQ3_9NOCA
MTTQVNDYQHCRTDTLQHPTMQVYSAGNFAEIAPQRLSPMSWSLVGRPMELGSRLFVGDILDNPSWATGSNYVFTGYFSCRPYHNLTAYCYVAEQVDLLTPVDITAAFFEGIEPPRSGLGAESGRIKRRRSSVRMMRELVSLRPRLMELEQRVFGFEHDVDAAVTTDADWRIGELAAAGNALLERAWHLHIVSSSGAVAAEVLQRKVVGRLAGKGIAMANWLKEPAELPWGRLFALSSVENGPGRFVSEPFYEIADTALPWADYAMTPIRPPATSDREFHDVSPREALVGMYDSARGRAIDASVLLLGDVMALREYSKSLCMRILHAHRRFVPRLAALRGVDDADWPYLSMAELRNVVPGKEEIERRRVSCEEALGVDMPDYLDLAPGASQAHQPRRVPRGVSAGICDGVAIEIDEIPEQPGAVLVCESADANIIPMLPFIGAVVTARGSQYSHVAIICRELGVPAVVSHPIARDIKSGQRVYVNGDSGEVRIL